MADDHANTTYKFSERTKNAQFIIISLRANMFELADRLVGIYKTYNCTKSVTVNPGLIAAPPRPCASQADPAKARPQSSQNNPSSQTSNQTLLVDN